MKVKILRETVDELEFEIVGEDHTFCNLLKAKLNSMEGTLAAYRIDHPLVSHPRFFIKVRGTKFEEKIPIEKIKVKGLGPKRIEKLKSVGIEHANDLEGKDLGKLSNELQIPKNVLEKILQEAKKVHPSIARKILIRGLEELEKEFIKLRDEI
ncbi:MAG: hypothetical protein DRN25_01250 [Thermoplasmata archaeon]|nr:MAG: hypothetical protein DRN25_01250 [Thermoplasmata archaeon]